MKTFIIHASELVHYMVLVEAKNEQEALRLALEAQQEGELYDFFGEPVDGDGINIGIVELK